MQLDDSILIVLNYLQGSTKTLILTELVMTKTKDLKNKKFKFKFKKTSVGIIVTD